MNRRRFLFSLPSLRIGIVGSIASLLCFPARASWVAAINAGLMVAQTFAKKGNGMGAMMQAMLSNQQIILDQLAGMQRQLTDIYASLDELKKEMPDLIDKGFEKDYYVTVIAMASSMRGYVGEDQAGVKGPNSLDSLFEKFEYDSSILRGKLALIPGLLSTIAMPVLLGVETFTLLRSKRLRTLKTALENYDDWIANSLDLSVRGSLASVMEQLSAAHKQVTQEFDDTKVFEQRLANRETLEGTLICFNGRESFFHGYNKRKSPWEAIVTYGEEWRIERRAVLTQTLDKDNVGYRSLTISETMVEFPEWRDTAECWFGGPKKYPVGWSEIDPKARIAKYNEVRKVNPRLNKGDKEYAKAASLVPTINNLRSQFAVHANAVSVVQSCSDRISHLRKTIYG